MKAYFAIAGLLALSTCVPSAFAEIQESPVRAVCTRSDQLGALMGTNTPKRTPLMVDDDGDAWMILENEATGLKVIGFDSPTLKAFCGIGAKGAKRAAPQRGA